ncbi:Interferon-inducible GTPase 5 [Manis javanica]|nr:Interferon-inducible GTPase 5 [Manis javanica]
MEYRNCFPRSRFSSWGQQRPQPLLRLSQGIPPSRNFMLTTSCISCCHFPKQAILCSHLLHRGPPTYPRLQIKNVISQEIDFENIENPSISAPGLYVCPGMTGCPADKYLKQLDFGRYDFFLLVSPRRCGAVETRLASEILRQGKKFYFVCTKVDEDLAATHTQRPLGFSEAAVLQEIVTTVLSGCRRLL